MPGAQTRVKRTLSFSLSVERRTFIGASGFMVGFLLEMAQ
jgi:hypothetical protein